MADEITYGATLRLDNGERDVDWIPADRVVDQAGTDFSWKTQEIGTSAEAIDLGEIGTPGVMLVMNLDGTNYVEIGYDEAGTFAPTIKLNGGASPNNDFAIFRHAQATPQARANTAACQIQYLVIEA